jgi:uncharacterized membrane protein
MDHNPYSPPQTEVREPLAPEDAILRPRQVTWAVRVLWVECAVSGVQVILENLTERTQQYPVAVLGVTVLLLALEAFVIYKLAARRNWARYVTLVTSVLGLLTWLAALKVDLQAKPVAAGLEAVELILDAIALSLLFTSSGRQWFKPRRAS